MDNSRRHKGTGTSPGPRRVNPETLRCPVIRGETPAAGSRQSRPACRGCAQGDKGALGAGPLLRPQALIDYAQSQTEGAEKVTAAPALGLPPESFPGYVLVREIKRGGQGVVYEAYHESTARTVAVKALRDPAFVRRGESARFEREIRILAELRHPNIVSLHDGGTAAGRRFIVMDYVVGRPLDAYVDEQACTVAEIAELFAKICDAVNAAHLRGVVHRDLKPDNILVDGDGEPHILDFGLAKLTEMPGIAGQPGPTVTVTGQFLGSLPWASPEQADGRTSDIDVRTDVYALGLVLFHLLTGRFPYDVSGATREVMEAIAHEPPQPPGAFRKDLPGDLETIILKCLKKDREERYQSAGDLRRELRRYLAGEAIEARRDSTWYVLAKTVRRHRSLAIGLISVLALSAVYAVTVTVLYRQASAAEQRAERSAAEARDKSARHRDTIEFLVDEVSGTLAGVPGAREVRRSILEGAFERLEAITDEVADDPALMADMARTHAQLGEIAVALADADRAQVHFDQALRLRRQVADAEPENLDHQADVSIDTVKLGDVARHRGDLTGARERYESAFRIDQHVVDLEPDNLHYLDNLLWSYDRLGLLAQFAGDLDKASAYHREQRRIAEQLLAAEPDNADRRFALFTNLRQLVGLARQLGATHEANAYCTEAVEIGERMLELDPDNPLYQRRMVAAYLDMAVYVSRGQESPTRWAWCRRADDLAQALVTRDPGAVHGLMALVFVHARSADLAIEEGDWALAAEHFADVISVARELVDRSPTFADGWVRLFHAESGLALAAAMQSRPAEAVTLCEQALATAQHIVSRRMFTEQFIGRYCAFICNVGQSHLSDPQEAVALLDETLEALDDPRAKDLLIAATAYRVCGMHERALALLERAQARAPESARSLRERIDAQIKACGKR